MAIEARQCIICKTSRLLCGRKTCPLISALRKETKIEKLSNKSFFGPSTSIFVGRKGYPIVASGPMTVMEEEESEKYNKAGSMGMEDPGEWFTQKLSMEEIIEMRTSLLRCKRSGNVKSKGRFSSELKEISMANFPTDVEISFNHKPSYKISFSDITLPTGPSVSIEKMKICENPRIEKKVESVVSDDLKAEEAAMLLYNDGLDVYKIATILSSGALGAEKNKRMVPTRWSITAIDDIIFRGLVSQLKEFPTIDSFYVYESSYMDNHFLILLMPSSFKYENFEAWFPGSNWFFPFSMQKEKENKKLKLSPTVLEEYEGFKGRKGYAEKEGGGYYAARLGVVEALHKMRRQASVVVFREIHKGYVIPLGVWVVREAVRNAFRREKEEFNSKEEALLYINSRLRAGIDVYMKQSKILRQKRLVDF